MSDPNDTPEHRAELGARLRWARELVEPNRHAFARKMQVHVTTIRDIESGKANASIWLLQRLCHTLRIDLDYLVEGRLSGIDAELRSMLVQWHPAIALRWRREQAAQRRAAARHDSEHKGTPDSKPHPPTIRAS